MPGITSKKKDVTPKHIVPYDPENIKLSKAEFVEKQRKLKERALKLREYGASLDKEEKVEKAPAAKEEPKQRGRPKKIE